MSDYAFRRERPGFDRGHNIRLRRIESGPLPDITREPPNPHYASVAGRAVDLFQERFPPGAALPFPSDALWELAGLGRSLWLARPDFTLEQRFALPREVPNVGVAHLMPIVDRVLEEGDAFRSFNGVVALKRLRESVFEGIEALYWLEALRNHSDTQAAVRGRRGVAFPLALQDLNLAGPRGYLPMSHIHSPPALVEAASDRVGGPLEAKREAVDQAKHNFVRAGTKDRAAIDALSRALEAADAETIAIAEGMRNS